eukprot:9119832-Ditylum_brightwellii.AAC.1
MMWSTCVRICTHAKVTKKIYPKIGHLPVKTVEESPWDTFCVDLIGPYTIERKGKHKNGKTKKDIILQCVTMIDSVASLSEIAEIKTKKANIIANIVETAWLTRYLYPPQVVLDRWKGFMVELSEMTLKDYGVKKKPITVRNPQANSIIKGIHQTIGNMIRSFEVHST